MAWQIADRIKETTTTTGTGAVTLAGSMTGYQVFSSALSDGDQCYYALQSVDGSGNPTGAWETGIGVYTSSGNTLSRQLISSSSGSLISLTGTTQIWLDVPASVASPLVFGTDEGGFIDGNFDSWQVNTTFSLTAATDTYTADMWVCNAGTGGAATVSQNIPALGSEIVGMTRPRKYRLAYQQTTNASTSPTIGQKLEGAGQYNGQSITVSGTFAAAASGTDIVGVRVTQNFGTGGSPSTSVVTSKTVAWALTTSEQRLSVRIDVPSISGKTLGTNSNDFVRIDFLLATGATYTVYASQVQIDACASTTSSNTVGMGGAPTPFRYRGLSDELYKVARHVQAYVVPANQTFLVGVVATTSEGFGCTFLPTPMRSSFTGSILSGSISWIGGGLTGASTITVSADVLKMITLFASGGSGGTVGYGGYFGAGAAGATILLDARL